MDARVVDKRKLPSRHVAEGPEHAPRRSYCYAMGLSSQQIHQSFVGVATCWNEAAPIGRIRDGDMIDIDTTTATLSVRLDDATLAARKREWKPRVNSYKSGAIWKYAQGVGPARKSAVTHPGGAADTTTYADI